MVTVLKQIQDLATFRFLSEVLSVTEIVIPIAINTT